MASVIRSFCCCKLSDSDDERQLITDNDDDRYRAIGSTDSNDHFWVGNTPTPSAPSNALSSGFKSGDEEDELLNQILETAQQNIIDVANIDGASAPCKEDLTMVQWYSDAIKQHDLLVRKRGSVSSAAADEFSVTLTDVGARALDILQRPIKSPIPFDKLEDYAKKINEAFVKGIHVEHKQDILVHMSFTED